jgi:hypothetical protein
MCRRDLVSTRDETEENDNNIVDIFPIKQLRIGPCLISQLGGAKTKRKVEKG